MPNCLLSAFLPVALLLLRWSEGAALSRSPDLNSSITLTQLENSESFTPMSDNEQQRQGRQISNGFLPGVQRVPLSFQGFLGSANQGGMGGVGSLTNGLDLETYTKNQAIRANQENAIVAQLSNMASVRKNQLARDISEGNVSATNELVSNLMRDLAISPAGNMAFPSFADRASVLSSENFGSQSAPQQQLMLARLLAEEQSVQSTRVNNGQKPQADLNRMLQMQALNGNNPGVFNQLSTAQLMQQQQQQQMRQFNGQQQAQLFQQQPNNPFLSPPPSLFANGNTNNPMGLSNLPLQMQQLNNERLLRNQLLLSALNQQQQLLQQQQQQQQQSGGTKGVNRNNNQQGAVNSMLSRPSPLDLASTPSPRNEPSIFQQDNGMLKFANTKMNMRDLDTSSPFFPSVNDGSGSSGLSRNLGGLANTNLDQQASNEGFVDDVADGFGRRLPGQLKDSVLGGNKSDTKKGTN